MSRHIRNAAAGLALVALAAGCSSRNTAEEGPTNLSLARGALAQVMAARRAPAQPAAPADPAAMAAEALAVNKGPLILVGLEGMGTTQVLAMTGENAGMRTFMTRNEQAVILRGQMLSGTRGLGNDLSVAEPGQAPALIAARQSGTSRRVMRYYSGDGKERPIDFTCEVRLGPKAGVMVEACAGHGLRFENSYAPAAGVSRQWIGPALGYVTIQVLRN